MMATRVRANAAAFPPGDFIKEELEARGWSQRVLAEILGRPLQTVNALVNGRKSITPRMARELEAAFGSSALFWLNLEIAYQLREATAADPEIARRARQHDARQASRSRRERAPADRI
jgi:HTH-type transcriptional regulator/antitoxin HigA